MDSKQVAQLAEQYGASLVLFARQWTRDPDDAVQEALVDLIRTQNPPHDPAAWLFTTVKRKALNQLRSESRRQKHTENFAANRDSWFVEHPSDPLVAGEVRELLERLPDEDREILVAKLWGNLHFEQIASVVGTSRSSVHRRYHAALAKLSNLLESNTR